MPCNNFLVSWQMISVGSGGYVDGIPFIHSIYSTTRTPPTTPPPPSPPKSFHILHIVFNLNSVARFFGWLRNWVWRCLPFGQMPSNFSQLLPWKVYISVIVGKRGGDEVERFYTKVDWVGEWGEWSECSEWWVVGWWDFFKSN